MLPVLCHRKGVEMKYKNGQKVDIGDGGNWRIIDVNCAKSKNLIELETVGLSEYRTLFLDESEIVELISDQWREE